MLFSISFANKLFVLENIEKTNISNSSVEDIFGDEQTFPFVAGLGKNAAHWFKVLDNVEKIF